MVVRIGHVRRIHADRLVTAVLVNGLIVPRAGVEPALARLSTWYLCLLGYRGVVPPDGFEPSPSRL